MRVPELWLLLTAPARGYVKQGLDRLGVPYKHVLVHGHDGVAKAYRALDVCLVTSRDEGGPKAVLEAMATGVPLVTTRVGQAADLVSHSRNGYIVDVEDANGIADWAGYVAEAPDETLARLAADRTGYGRGVLLRRARAALARAARPGSSLWASHEKRRRVAAREGSRGADRAVAAGPRGGRRLLRPSPHPSTRRSRRGRDGEVPAPAGRLPAPAARLQSPLSRLELAAD